MMAAPGPGPDGVGQPELDGITGPDGHPEVIGAQFADPPAARARAWLRAHPRLRVGLVGLAAIAAAAALAVAVRAGARLVSGPRLPELSVTAFENRPEVTVWVTRADGRPEGPLMLPMLVTLRLVQPIDVQVSVLGIRGPGVVGADDEPAPIPTGMRQWTADLRAAVDCDRVPATPTATAYRLLLAVRAGSRTVERSTALGPAGREWITSVQDACASWQARRDLTVTAVAAVTDPTRTRTTLTVVVTNTGRQPALLGPVPVCCEVSVEPAAPLRVPALSAASAAFTVVLERCDTVTRPVGGAAPLTTDPRLSSEIGLAALAGPRLPSDLTGFVELDPTIDGFGPTGVVFGREARRRPGRRAPPGVRRDRPDHHPDVVRRRAVRPPDRAAHGPGRDPRHAGPGPQPSVQGSRPRGRPRDPAALDDRRPGSGSDRAGPRRAALPGAGWLPACRRVAGRPAGDPRGA
jgi:hypothetical protein